MLVSIELVRGQQAKGRVSALSVVSDLEIFEDRVGELNAGVPAFADEQPDLHAYQNDSTMALSKQSPTEPIEGSSPESTARSVNAQEVNWVPWSLWITVSPTTGLRLSIAMPNALVTIEAVGRESMDQPTTRRLKVSSTTVQ